MLLKARDMISYCGCTNGRVVRMGVVSGTLEYLITVQHLLNVHNGKLDHILLANKDNLMWLNSW